MISPIQFQPKLVVFIHIDQIILKAIRILEFLIRCTSTFNDIYCCYCCLKILYYALVRILLIYGSIILVLFFYLSN